MRYSRIMTFKKLYNYFFVVLFMSFASSASANNGITGVERHNIAKDHTNIVWYISHMGFSRTIGSFNEFEGIVDLNFDDPSKSKILITIQTDSITSGVTDLDQKLKGDQFFKVDEYPEASFESTDITLIENDTATVRGNFTMLGKTDEISLDVRFNKRAMDPILNRMRTGFSIKSSLQRSRWGMDQMLAFVSDEIAIVIEAEALRIAD